MMTCHSCGKQVAEGVKYCPDCGAMLICPKCGKELNGEKFCPNCGQSTAKGQSKAKAVVAGVMSKVKSIDKKKLRNILIISLLVVAVLVGIIVPSVVLTDKFRKAKVSKIEIGMSREEVRGILGDPDEEMTVQADAWLWYQNKAKKSVKEMNESLESDDLADFLNGMNNVYSKLEKMSYKSIIVEFKKDKVSGVALNMDTKYDASLYDMDLYACHKEKTVKSFELSHNTIGLNDSIANAGIVYTATFKDGSYRKAYLSHARCSGVDLSTIGIQALNVSDEWGSYTAQVSITALEESEVSGIRYELNADGESYSASGPTDTLNGHLAIPNTVFGLPVTAIKESAFQDCTGIASVTIPDSVKSIGYFAFDHCTGITRVNYGGDLKGWCEIEFANHSSNPLYRANNAKLYVNNVEVARAVKIPAGTTKIGDWAFYGQTGITSVTIPDSVTSIGDYAFEGCTGLQKVTIPDSVTSIGDLEFNSCFSLTRIDYRGTTGQWQALPKGVWWNDGTGEYTVYCTDGAVSKSGVATPYA